MAKVVGSLKGQSAMAVARQCGGRIRHCNGATFWARGCAVSTVGCEAEHMRRSLRTQEQLDAQGRDADGDVSESRRTCIWQGDRTILTRLLILSHSAFSAASTKTPHERRRAQVRTLEPGRVSTPVRWGR